MPGGFVCSASLKGKRATRRFETRSSAEKPIRKLLSKEQRAFFAANAPDGLDLDDLSVLGPIFVLKLKFTPGVRTSLVAELDLPGRLAILELSTKCPPTEASGRGRDERIPCGQGIDLSASSRPRRRRHSSSSRRNCRAASGFAPSVARHPALYSSGHSRGLIGSGADDTLCSHPCQRATCRRASSSVRSHRSIRASTTTSSGSSSLICASCILAPRLPRASPGQNVQIETVSSCFGGTLVGGQKWSYPEGGEGRPG